MRVCHMINQLILNLLAVLCYGSLSGGVLDCVVAVLSIERLWGSNPR